jgi:exopolyphosphatase / guanosine-5'-triphosphate,3'-diphosphate pyrophosphatase
VTGAAIDIGSNSVHMLVARVRPVRRRGSLGTLLPVDDRSDLIGLGDVVQGVGSIPPEQLQAVVDSLRAMRAAAADLGARDVVAMGTEPLRRAANADELVAAVERQLGMTIAVLTERQEAQLSYLGVTGGRRPAEPLAVIDIGGGSTELALHAPGAPLQVIPLRVGSAVLTSQIVRHDPPTAAEIDQLRAAAQRAVAAAPWPDGQATVERAVFLGGTATNVARLGRLDRSHLDDDQATLAALSADEVVSYFGVRPRRARQLAAGVAIIRAVLDRLGLATADVSEASLRDGAILARSACGDEWLARLDELTD